MPSSKCVIKWGRLFKWAKLTESNVQRRYCKCFSRSVEGLRTTHLKQHERGVLHRFRRATALGCSPNLPGTPSMDTFLGVVERRLKGESLRKSPLGRYKEKKISWCLNEAMLDMERKKLGKCQVALISQDAQGPMLSVRFAWCQTALRNHSAVNLNCIKASWGSSTAKFAAPEGLPGQRCKLQKLCFRLEENLRLGGAGRRRHFTKRLGSIFAEGWNLGGKALLAPCFKTKCFSLTLTLLRKCLLRMRPLN